MKPSQAAHSLNSLFRELEDEAEPAARTGDNPEVTLILNNGTIVLRSWQAEIMLSSPEAVRRVAACLSLPATAGIEIYDLCPTNEVMAELKTVFASVENPSDDSDDDDE